MAGDLVPRRYDKAALERIIQRAAELQAGEMDTSEGMSEQDVLKLGVDVGIPGRFLRQALYEETSRGGVMTERGAFAAWAGPRLVAASRVIPGERMILEQALDAWMTDGEALIVKRRMPDRTVWERQRGLFAEMRRGLSLDGKSYHLARALEVSVSVMPLEEGYCHIQLSADVSNSRSSALGGAASSVGAGAVVSAILIGASITPFTVVGAIPLALGVGIAAGIPRAHKRNVARIQLALEQVLDGLERGEIRPKSKPSGPRASAFVRIADELKRSFDGVAHDLKRSVEGAADGGRRQVPPPSAPPRLPPEKDRH